MSARKKVFTSIKWILLLRYSTRALDVFKYAIITRILSQSDVGSFVLATTIVITFEALSDTGFTFAFIQKQAAIEKYAKTLWIISIVRGFIIATLVFVSAGIFSWFFKSQNLYWLLAVSSLVPFIKGFQSPYVISYQKNLQFHKEFFYRIIPLFISSILSILLVLFFKTPMALVIAIVIGSITETLFSFLVTKTSFDYPFSMEKVRELFGYGKYLTVGSVFTLLMTQIDSLFVGKFFGTSILAIYELAFKLANIVFSEITDMISRVAFPFFSQIQHDKQKLMKAFLFNMIGVSLPAVGVSLIFFLFPQQILTIAFGRQYSSGSTVLQILSIYGLLRAIIGPVGPLFLSLGKPAITTYMNLANFLLVLVLIYPLSIAFGLNGVALSMVLSYLFILPYIFLKVSHAFTLSRTQS